MNEWQRKLYLQGKEQTRKGETGTKEMLVAGEEK